MPADRTHTHQKSGSSVTREAFKRFDELEVVKDDLLEALRVIDGEAPTKEPSANVTVGPPPGWREEMAEYVYEIVREAFEEGKARGRWEAAQTARSAIQRAGSEQ